MGKKSLGYTSWTGLRQRCANPNNPKWHRYGGRGITYCPTWESFTAFHSDMGDPPSPLHSLDRIDNDGPYTKENCRWTTAKEQLANKGRYKNNKSGLTGLFKERRGKYSYWIAYIDRDGNRKILGRSKCFGKAFSIRKAA